MTTEAAVADTSNKTVTFAGATYAIQALGEDSKPTGDNVSQGAGCI
jgi:hypothetical protein